MTNFVIYFLLKSYRFPGIQNKMEMIVKYESENI